MILKCSFIGLSNSKYMCTRKISAFIKWEANVSWHIYTVGYFMPGFILLDSALLRMKQTKVLT
jgi:hypothetical protein